MHVGGRTAFKMLEREKCFMYLIWYDFFRIRLSKHHLVRQYGLGAGPRVTAMPRLYKPDTVPTVHSSRSRRHGRPQVSARPKSIGRFCLALLRYRYFIQFKCTWMRKQIDLEGVVSYLFLLLHRSLRASQLAIFNSQKQDKCLVSTPRSYKSIDEIILPAAAYVMILYSI